MDAGFSAALAFATGLLGAFHCWGMCGGLAGGIALHQGWWGRAGALAAYHGARIAVYVVLGTVGALLGRTLLQTGLLGKGQGLLMMAGGAVIVLLGLGVAGWLPRAAPARCRPAGAAQPVSWITPARARWAPLAGGLVNGLVPCSLVFSVAVKAAVAANPAEAALWMLCFGLGTLPAMGAVSALAGLLGLRARGAALRAAGVAVVALGGWTLYEGAVFYQVMSGLANW